MSRALTHSGRWSSWEARVSLLGVEFLEEGQRLGLLHARAGQAGPAADQTRAGLDAVDVDAADQAAVARHRPARRQRVTLAQGHAAERRAAADHPLHEVDVVLLHDDGDAGV